MKYCVTIDNKRYEVEVEKGSAAIVSTTEIAPKAMEEIKASSDQAAATTETPKAVETVEKAAVASPVVGKATVKAPMAGGITDIKVNVGSAVKTGDVLLMLEAMKMENEITATVDGIIAEIRVSKGTSVVADEVLVVLS